MKILSLFFIMLSILLSLNVINARNAESNDQPYVQIAYECLRPYFKALKNGDVASIKDRIAGKMLQRNRILLEKNKSYPEYLRNYYHGVDFCVETAKRVKNEIFATTIIMFPGKEPGKSIYILRRYRRYNTNDANDSLQSDVWKIVRHIEE